METLEQIKELWSNNEDTDRSSLNRDQMDAVIRSRINKEKKGIAEYFWVAFVFQVMLYSFASYLIVKYWNDFQIAMPAAAGIAMYIPLTIVLTKLKSMFNPRPDYATDIRSGIYNERQLLQSFFTFKKRFDLISIPVTSIILVWILFRLYVPGSVEQNVFWAVVCFVLLVLMYAIAAWFENRKHFTRPLRQLDLVLEEIDDQSSSQL
jgi:hypothetical protein